MSSKIILKKSSVTGKVPQAADLEYGELALNYNDGALYYKRSDNTVQALISSGETTVTDVAGYTGSVTALQLLDTLKTVDGTGSGLDADALNGKSYTTIVSDATAIAIAFGG